MDMKKALAFLIALAFVLPIFVDADQYVSGHYRKNGTYVEGYYRSSPDGSPYNNYSYPGNTNPYTGKTAGGSTESYLNNYYNTSSYSSYSYPTTYSSYSYPSAYSSYSAPSAYSSYTSTSYPSSYTSSVYTSSLPTSAYYSTGSYSNTVSEPVKATSKVITCGSGTVKMDGRCVNYPTYCRATYGEGYVWDAIQGNCASCPSGYKYDWNGKCQTPATLDFQANAESQKQAADRLKRKGRI